MAKKIIPDEERTGIILFIPLSNLTAEKHFYWQAKECNSYALQEKKINSSNPKERYFVLDSGKPKEEEEDFRFLGKIEK